MSSAAGAIVATGRPDKAQKAQREKKKRHFTAISPDTVCEYSSAPTTTATTKTPHPPPTKCIIQRKHFPD